MTSGSSVPSRETSSLGVLELRGLRALRRAGSLGLLHNDLRRKMRPSHGWALILSAIRNLEQLGLVEHFKSDRPGRRLQGAWRITSRGRAAIDANDPPPLPPAA